MKGDNLMTLGNIIGTGFGIMKLLAIVLLLAGGILGYGGKQISRLIFNDISDKNVLIIKLIGLILAACGAVIFFKI
jgi:hypothetical protein